MVSVQMPSGNDPGKTLVSERERHARRLFAELPANYDLMARVLSFGQDARWRAFLTSRVPVRPGGMVLDVATGTGMVAAAMARRTGARVVALDQSYPMVREAIRRSQGNGVEPPVRFVLGHGDRLPFPDGTFDAVTFTYLLRYVPDPAAALAELARTVRPDGVLANLEFHVPQEPLWRGLWHLYTRTGLPLLGGIVSGAWYRTGRFLGPSISSFYRRHPLDRQLALWRAAGIADVRARVMSLGGGVVIWGTRHAG